MGKMLRAVLRLACDVRGVMGSSSNFSNARSRPLFRSSAGTDMVITDGGSARRPVSTLAVSEVSPQWGDCMAVAGPRGCHCGRLPVRAAAVLPSQPFGNSAMPFLASRLDLIKPSPTLGVHQQ